MTADASSRESAGRDADPAASLRRRVFGFGGLESAVQTALAAAGPIAAVSLLWGRANPIAFVAAALIPTPLILAALALRHRSRWPAQEVLGWLDSAAATIAGAAADGSPTNDPSSTTPERSVLVAYESALEAVSRGLDGVSVLASARPFVGRLAPGLARKLLLSRLRFAAASALFGAWLLVAIVVGLATAGGVVWF